MALSPELTGLIVSYLTGPPLDPREQRQAQSCLSQYATVDRVWQEFIEKRTFSTLCLGTAKRLDEFRRLNLDSRRKSYIRRIDLIVELERYDVDARSRFETDEEHQRNNRLFTQAIQSLLQVLSSWPNNSRGIELSITAQSPSDFGAISDQGERRMRRKAALFHRTEDLLDQRFEKSYLQLDESFKRLSVPIISSLNVSLHWDGRLIQPASCARLSSNLPCLRSVTLALSDDCKRDKPLRKCNRNGFATLFHLWPPTVQKFYLGFGHIAPRNHSFFPENVTENNSDLLSSRIREFSQQLTHITIGPAVMGKEVFWPLYPEGKDVNLPFWPYLVSFSVDFTPVTPSGDWLFERDPNELNSDKIESEDSDPEGEYPDYVRTVPEDRSGGHIRSKSIPAFFNELYRSAGQAALRMPRLKYMSLKTECGFGRHWFRYEIKNGVAKVIWADTHVFHPEDNILQIWKDVASRHTGNDLEVKIADSRYI